ncbi:ABC transporter substrate-binding protein [Mangrovimicrobium sediminis]|uniref:ABC transporter substrate-binding protein n=1 Tax=Mangrovimicrobium sediminis TaxID=2562682 RepID=A0A4Z0LY97_9GAMM|nr:ABC transporter substrate-binding protein [Haliea sp. SAOS-164]TGD72108.1 ABC transporter substrate-binding protein [Haliea sp. SAOS-164]
MAIRVQRAWVLGLFLWVGFASAGQASVTAHDVVRQTTEQVMATVAEARGYVEEDPSRYYTKIEAILDPVVDFRGFARGVMGPYASSERYRSLDEAGREKLREQLDRFTEVMRSGLVQTYGKGLLAFGGSRIEVSRPAPDEAEQSRATVEQLIYSDQAEPYVVYYQMGRDGDGAWKLRNMIIQSVNLGEIYRNQFQAAAREHDGDLDKVIAGWNVVAEVSS